MPMNVTEAGSNVRRRPPHEHRAEIPVVTIENPSNMRQLELGSLMEGRMTSGTYQDKIFNFWFFDT